MSKNSHRYGINVGHQTNTPNLPVLREVELPSELKLMIALGHLQVGTRYYRMGKVKILVSPPTAETGWHMTCSVDDRYPTWAEIAKAWYELVPEAENRQAMMPLPPKSEYINIHDFCLHVHEIATDKPTSQGQKGGQNATD